MIEEWPQDQSCLFWWGDYRSKSKKPKEVLVWATVFCRLNRWLTLSVISQKLLNKQLCPSC